jgi:hypothetical protein
MSFQLLINEQICLQRPQSITIAMPSVTFLGLGAVHACHCGYEQHTDKYLHVVQLMCVHASNKDTCAVSSAIQRLRCLPIYSYLLTHES